MNTEQKTLLEKVTGIFSIITLAYFFLSYMSLSYYYWLFDIDIASYVDVKYLTFNWISSGPFWFYIVPMFVIGYGKDIINSTNNVVNGRTSNGIRKVITVMICMTIGFGVLSYFTHTEDQLIPALYLFFLFLFSFLTTLHLDSIKKDKKILTNFVAKDILLLLLMAMFIQYTKARIVKNKTDIQIAFKYGDKCHVRTSKDTSYIGQLTDYIFLYDIKSKTSLVYKIQLADSIVIRNKSF